MNPRIHNFFDDIDFTEITDSSIILRMASWDRGQGFAYGNSENTTFFKNSWNHCVRKNFDIVYFNIMEEHHPIDKTSEKFFFGNFMGNIKFRNNGYIGWKQEYLEAIQRYLMLTKREKVLVYHFIPRSIRADVMETINKCWRDNFSSPNRVLIKVMKTG